MSGTAKSSGSVAESSGSVSEGGPRGCCPGRDVDSYGPLYLTISGCECAHPTVELTYEGGLSWFGVLPDLSEDCQGTTVQLTCVHGGLDRFDFHVYLCDGTATLHSCDPFSASADVNPADCPAIALICGGGSMHLEFTE